VQRLRLLFTKSGPARFISHLDLARSFERSLVRASIPVAYSQGFNRRPRMHFAAPLPLGITSEHELADIWLSQSLRPEQLRSRLNAKIAPGLFVKAVDEIPLEGSALQTLTSSASYEAMMPGPTRREELQNQIEALLSSDSRPFERKRGKKIRRFDIRPMILELTLADWSPQQAMLFMSLSLLPGKTGRPDDVLAAMGLDPLSARIHRTSIVLLSQPEVIP
jgi:radical SAM-linked protein